MKNRLTSGIISTIVYITAVVIIGMFVFEKLDENRVNTLSLYQASVKIRDHETMEYADQTSVGHAMVQGDFVTKDPVKFDEMNKSFFAVRKVKERYTMHTRTVKSGKTTRTEIYYTWDYAGEENLFAKRFEVLSVEFKSPKDLRNNGLDKIDASKITDKASGKYYKSSPSVRYYYEVFPQEFSGVLTASIKNGELSRLDKNNPPTIYKNLTSSKVIENYENDRSVLFWLAWIVAAILIYAIAIYKINEY